MAQNASDGLTRRYVLVNSQRCLTPKRPKKRCNFCDNLKISRNIAELTKKRLRRASKTIKNENSLFSVDLGFRVFKLDSSNIRAWEPDPTIDQTILDYTNHIKDGRTEQDILYELLKLGLDLCVPIEQKAISGKAVHSVGGGVLMACLSPEITREDVEPLTRWWPGIRPLPQQATTCVFRDSAFANDVAKTNLAAILIAA